jgi:sterol desaturase/sphingolipid hydroxylase (fatty acid hydroxylase superfamily)
MTASNFQNVKLFVISALLTMIAFEFIVCRIRGVDSYSLKSTLTTAGIQFISKLLGPLALFAVIPLEIRIWEYRLFDLPRATIGYWILLFFAVDLFYYFEHRASHRISWMWASHSIHHSVGEMNMLANARVGATNFISISFAFFIPMIFVGFHPYDVATVFALCVLYAAVIHTELVDRLGILEQFLNTPSSHRLHHSSKVEHLDRNFGGVLVIWDRMFGTFMKEEHRITAYGLAGREAVSNPVKLVAMPWIELAKKAYRARGWRRLWALVGPPETATNVGGTEVDDVTDARGLGRPAASTIGVQ